MDPWLTKELLPLVEAAEQGDSQAQYELSRFSYGHRRSSEFKKWSCLAANQGNAKAQFARGLAYESREWDAKVDYLNAFLWYSLASSNGHEWAPKYLKLVVSRMSRDEIAQAERLVSEWVPEDCAAELERMAAEAKALEREAERQEWQSLCLAAHNGSPEAQYRIGTMYEDGQYPISEDFVLALAWYRLALEGGYEDRSGSNYRQTDSGGWECCFPGTTRAEIITEVLSDAEVAKAKEIVSNWQRNPAECEAIAAQAKK